MPPALARLHKAKPLTTVGLVYKNSPAKRAGLQQGDKVMAWGLLQNTDKLHERFGFQPNYGNDSSDPLLVACKFESVRRPRQTVCRAVPGSPVLGHTAPLTKGTEVATRL